MLLVSCHNETKPQLSPAKDLAKVAFSKAIGEGVAYKVFPVDSLSGYTERFVKVLVDSSDVYCAAYSKSFQYLIGKKKQPTEADIKKEVDKEMKGE